MQPSLYSGIIIHFVNRFIYPRASSSDCSKQTLQNVSRKAHKILMGQSNTFPGKNRHFTLRRFPMITSVFCLAPCTGGAVKSLVCPAPDLGVPSVLGFVHFLTPEVPRAFLVNEERTRSQLVANFGVVQRSTMY